MDLIDLTGRYTIARGPLDWAQVNGGAWHHSVTMTPRPDWSRDEEISVLDAIDRYHRERNWRDWRGNLVSLGGFAYHLAAFPSRRAYLVTPLAMRGAHVASHNGHLVGVVFIGVFTTLAPATSQLETAAEAQAYVEHTRNKQLTWRGHRDWAAPGSGTACPGDTWRSWVPTISLPAEEQEEDQMIVLVSPRGRDAVYVVTPDGYRVRLVDADHMNALIALGLVKDGAVKQVDPGDIDALPVRSVASLA